MKMEIPNKDKWNGWVVLAWMIAVVSCVVSLWLVSELGYVEVPTRSSLTGQAYTSGTETVVNWGVWGWAIGQSVGALMIAALFSIANSTYQNSCQTVKALAALHKDQQPEPLEPGKIDKNSGLLVERVRPASPLVDMLKDGDRLLRINGHEPEDKIDAACKVVNGENKIVFCNQEGEIVTETLTMRPGPLHITFADT